MPVTKSHRHGGGLWCVLPITSAQPVSAQFKIDEDAKLKAQGKCNVSGQQQLGHPNWMDLDAPGSVTWAPMQDRFLLVDCHKGQVATPWYFKLLGVFL